MNAFAEAFAQLPEPQRKRGARHLREFLERGFPAASEEEWRYTDLSALAAASYAPAEPSPVRLSDLAGAETVTFANGTLARGSPALVGAIDSEQTPDGVTALNAAFAETGLTLSVPANTQRVPLLLDTWFGGAAQHMSHLRHRVRLAANAEATLVLRERGDAAPFFATQVLDIELAPGAQLRLYRVQQYGAATTALTRIDARLGPDSQFDCVALHAGGALVRNDVNVTLAQGAAARLSGVLAPAGKEHLDVHTRIEHHGTHALSRERFRNVVQDAARAVFNGKVVVHPGAQRTDSEQHVDSLLLSPQAQVNAKPELEIYADDVKCAHGATCGQLDEAQLFYLRARGMPAPQARSLLIAAFAQSVLQEIVFEPARKLAEQALRTRLPGAPALAEIV